jgi:oligoribonuclease NrnB/cAMP/cGMP phosphodiesterase (DHH superfamily)
MNNDIATIESWSNLFDIETVFSLINKGNCMQEYNNYLLKTNISKHIIESFPSKIIYDKNPDIFKSIGQYKVAVFCGNYFPFITDLSVYALKELSEIDFCIFWTYNTKNKKYIISMRSRDIDVCSICKIFNGGGHKSASACSFSLDEFTINDLFS